MFCVFSLKRFAGHSALSLQSPLQCVSSEVCDTKKIFSATGSIHKIFNNLFVCLFILLVFFIVLEQKKTPISFLTTISLSILSTRLSFMLQGEDFFWGNSFFEQLMKVICHRIHPSLFNKTNSKWNLALSFCGMCMCSGAFVRFQYLSYLFMCKFVLNLNYLFISFVYLKEKFCLIFDSTSLSSLFSYEFIIIKDYHSFEGFSPEIFNSNKYV